METFQRFYPSLINFHWPLSAEVEIKLFAYHMIIRSMSHVTDCYRAAITNWGKMYYKLWQILQIRAIITNWGITDRINFVTVNNRVLVFPETLSPSVIVKRLYEKEIQLERV